MKTIFCNNVRTYDFLIALVFPYIDSLYTFSDDIEGDKNYIKFLYNNEAYYVKKYNNSHQVRSEDILLVSDDEIVSRDYLNYTKFSVDKICGVFTEGESYIWEDGVFNNILNNNGKILTSTILSKNQENPDYFYKIFKNKNLYSHVSLGFYSFISRNEIKFLTHLNELNFNLNKKYDIGIYSRYGYKEWRDLFTDFLRNYSEKIKIKEIDNFKNNIGFTKYTDLNSIKNHTLLKSRGKDFLHFLFPMEMGDSKINVVYETSLEVTTIFMTEKMLKQYLFGFLSYIICPKSIRDEVKKIGFFSLDMFEYNSNLNLSSYELNLNKLDSEYDIPEFINFCKFIDFISNMDENKYEEFIDKNYEISKNNIKIVEDILYTDNIHRRSILDFLLL